MAPAYARQRAPERVPRADDETRIRLSEDEIVQELELPPTEVVSVIERYESNLVAIVEMALRHDVDVVLMTVASNWRWLGREDLPPTGAGRVLPERGASTQAADSAALLDVLTRRLGTPGLRNGGNSYINERSRWKSWGCSRPHAPTTELRSTKTPQKKGYRCPQ